MKHTNKYDKYNNKSQSKYDIEDDIRYLGLVAKQTIADISYIIRTSNEEKENYIRTYLEHYYNTVERLNQTQTVMQTTLDNNASNTSQYAQYIKARDTSIRNVQLEEKYYNSFYDTEKINLNDVDVKRIEDNFYKTIETNNIRNTNDNYEELKQVQLTYTCIVIELSELQIRVKTQYDLHKDRMGILVATLIEETQNINKLIEHMQGEIAKSDKTGHDAYQNIIRNPNKGKKNLNEIRNFTKS